MAATHPFVPPSLEVPGYVPNKDGLETILGSFFVVVGAVALTTIAAAWRTKHFNTTDRVVVVWMMICGCVHLFLEGYYSLYNRTFVTRQDIFAQIWKEYSQSDSRYAISDPFIVAMETVTAFVEGPGAFLGAYAMFKRLPWADITVFAVSLGEFYGCVLYFALEWLEGFTHSRPEAYYFWFYFFFFNFLWIVLPLFIIVRNWGRIVNAYVAASGKAKTN